MTVMLGSGKVLPCKVVKVSGSVVTVSFDVTSSVYTLPQVTCPVAYPEYIRLPIQIGDSGYVIPSSVSIGHASGLGTGGPPPIDDVAATLSDVMYLPLASVNFPASDDANALVLYGPNGIVLRDSQSNCKVVLNTQTITVSAPQTITIMVGSKKIVLSTSGVDITGDVSISGNISVSGTSNLVGLVTVANGTKAVALNGDSVVSNKVVASSTGLVAR